MDDIINSFTLDRINKSGARFDMDKAKWINSQHLKITSNTCLMPYVDLVDDRYDSDKINDILDLAKDRSDFRSELNDIVKLFFTDPVITSYKKIDDSFNKVFADFDNLSKDINFDNKDDIKQLIYDTCTSNGLKMGKVMPGLRMALVGGISGPDLLTTMRILGRKETIKRLNNALVGNEITSNG